MVYSSVMDPLAATRSLYPYIVGNLYFTLGVSVTSGISNSVTSLVRSEVNIGIATLDFFHAFGGNLGLGILVNFIPAIFNHNFSQSKYFWLTGNIMMLCMNALMLGFHYLIQIENPLEARIVPTLASQILQNILIIRSVRARIETAAH